MKEISLARPRRKTFSMADLKARLARAYAKIDDDADYLIRRHGSYFRPNAKGYTRDLSDVGVYPGREAKKYLDVEGLTIVPLDSLRGEILRGIETHSAASAKLTGLLGRVEAARDRKSRRRRPAERADVNSQF